MSTWTHITGIIRVDDLFGHKWKEFNEIFIENTFEKPSDKCNMPAGSEGSLRWNLITNPDDSSLAKYIIVLWGDLRDFGKDDIHEIQQWWDNVLPKCGMVRQAVLQIQPADGKQVILDNLKYNKEMGL